MRSAGKIVRVKDADVDDPTFRIQPLQRFQRVAVVTKFTVVVVFDDCRVVRSAQSSRDCRRASGNIAPVGNWCDGVYISSAGGRRSSIG